MIEFKTTKNNEYQFLVKSKTGQTLLTSIPFPSKKDLDTTLTHFKKATKNNSKLFERRTNTEGKFLVELKNTNGKTIGSSGLYSSEAGLENGIANIANNL